MRLEFSDLPKWETDAQLIQPSRLVFNIKVISEKRKMDYNNEFNILISKHDSNSKPSDYATLRDRYKLVWQ